MLWNLLLPAAVIALAVGPFLLASFKRPFLGLALPAAFLLLVSLAADDESPEYDMPGFGAKLLVVAGLVAAIAWMGGVIAGAIRSRGE
jgi:hypothetical protein